MLSQQPRFLGPANTRGFDAAVLPLQDAVAAFGLSPGQALLWRPQLRGSRAWGSAYSHGIEGKALSWCL